MFESNVHCELSLEMYLFATQLRSIMTVINNVLSQAVRYPSPAAHSHPAMPPYVEVITSASIR